jgi:hypothetical protein
MGTRSFSLGIKRPGREADHSSPSSAEVKNVWSYTSTPNTPSWLCAQLKQRDNFNFYYNNNNNNNNNNVLKLHNEELHNLYSSTNIVMM